ncbi:MAG: glycoside hydrolase family 2 protein [Phreatobacter sp.]|uniref:glycosyl hydrolase 2 galactose-binding domain-containing protein n=1 Tax=Phreatobacter sp. TaxID=1966341 RepID=UPI001A4FE817|nr:glycoside hydrolase family 2 protein [Phreatobacter sp.]MBL8569681.1 glycoside hydrolase family 2 protein [Phreatobacter sp.]
MARIRSISGDTSVLLAAGWSLTTCEADAAAVPGDLPADCAWLPAEVPGTVESAFRAAGGQAPDGRSLHDLDVWYRIVFEARGACTFRFHGLATHAEIFLDGQPVLASNSMFLAHDLDFAGTGRQELAIRFRALNASLAEAKGPRARWRPMMIQPGTLRLARTTPLGHMPGWTPPVAIVGPWQPVELIHRGAPFRVRSTRLVAGLHDDLGVLDASITLDGTVTEPVELLCAGHAHALHRSDEASWSGRLTMDGIAPWWPYTHGEPALHDVAIRVGSTVVGLGRVGFRALAVDHGADGKGFALVVNKERIFCRGASWMPADPAAPAARDPRHLLTLARDAGMNMIRLSGTMTPESDAFHDLCDEFGILVWHDLPFANFDYPAADPAFAALVEAEVRQLLDRRQGAPSLAVICGGSEIAQQATMLGLTPQQAAMPLFEETFSAITAESVPQAAYVPHTPWGGALPFTTDEGVTHYFGVGAYRRPLEDARRAEVRFASECLAFANVPSPAALRRDDLNNPASVGWKRGVPRDAGADWDFEDVRDHYVRALYGVDPEALRSADPARYLALGRAAPAELMEAVFAEWRRAGSPCGGGLVWFLNDLMPGAGWGVLDHAAMPKSTYHALKRAFRPVHLGLTDEGLNGLGIHLTNETAESRRLVLSLASYGEGPHPLAKTATEMTLTPGSATSTTSHALLGRFFDIANAYRFGPRAHEVTLARLADAETGALVAEAAHVLPGCAAEPRDIGLAVQTGGTPDAPILTITSERLARFVTIDDERLCPDDEGFCLAPGESRLVPLRGAPGPAPRGAVAALNSHPVAYGVAA